MIQEDMIMNLLISAIHGISTTAMPRNDAFNNIWENSKLVTYSVTYSTYTAFALHTLIHRTIFTSLIKRVNDCSQQ